MHLKILRLVRWRKRDKEKTYAYKLTIGRVTCNGYTDSVGEMGMGHKLEATTFTYL